MPVSLSDGATAVFVGCRSGDALAAVGSQHGYAITVGMTAASLFAYNMSHILPAMKDSAVEQAAAELWLGLQVISNYALVPEYPNQPKVSNGSATILAVTYSNAFYMSCGELVTAIGDASPLAVVRLERVDVSKVRGVQAVETRGNAQSDAENSGVSNPFNDLERAVQKLGIGLGVAVALGVAAAVVIYAPKRS